MTFKAEYAATTAALLMRISHIMENQLWTLVILVFTSKVFFF